MNSCPTCAGQPGLHPCPALCTNVLKGCLAHHVKAQDGAWDTMAESMLALTERLAGNFNLETTVLPLDISISSAIMNLQESGFQVTQRAFGLCGQPKVVGRRKREALDKREAKVESGSIENSHLDSSSSTTVVDESMLRRSKRPLGVTAQGTSSLNRRSKFERLLMDVRKTVSKIFLAAVAHTLTTENTSDSDLL